ncbi:copper homeostasis protein CutC [Labrys miyagiensis]|uniref:PF03932 family protein CutC n=1 Tax=Labrys miyagiensis TaxID=346912 RepID=A0ABQ6CTC3_9HYPH|nr:copper homeostasis protein CutC [Labrys miyagiensis]GLS23628.1 copper homeostasis protein CutC [Labrys miyagiensis]
MTIPLLEVCVDDADSLLAAFEGGADRIELCSALEVGGLTPTPGLMRLAATLPIPVYAMVRPRPGDFVFGEGDVGTMLADIDAIRAAGLAGVVLGASRPDGALDVAVLERLAERADGLGMTLHRAFDLVPDIAEAMEVAVALGFERILTSGGALIALAGLARLKQTFDAAQGRIGVMPGSGLAPANVAAVLEAVPAFEVHSSCSVARPSAGGDAVRLGFAGESRRVTTRDAVVAFRRSMTP